MSKELAASPVKIVACENIDVLFARPGAIPPKTYGSPEPYITKL